MRQGDPLYAYLLIIVLGILCISSMCNSKDIRGIKFKVDKEEIRLSLFADDPTGFLTIFRLGLQKITEVAQA